MTTVVVTDYTFDDLSVETDILRAAGCKVVSYKDKRPAADVAKLVADADAVITQFAPVNADVIAAMTKARVIVRYGIGVDNVDLDAARKRGIPVCNVPDYCIDEVADQTLAFVLTLTRAVGPNSHKVKSGGWGLGVPLSGMRTLCDMTVGVVGCGRIGRQVMSRLAPFRCRLLAHDPGVSRADIEAAGAMAATFDEIIAESDVVTLHCPSTAATRGMMSRDVFARMKPGAIFVNVARGDLADSAALVEALREGRLGGAGLDVFDPEPIPPGSEILRMDNVVVASHVASASVRAVRRLRETAAGIAARVIRGEPAVNVVNGVT